MFKTRLLSGILLVIIAVATIVCGGDVLFATLLMISFIGMTEVYRVMEISGSLLGIAGYVAAGAYYVLLRMGLTEWIVCLAIVFLMVLMAVYVLTYPKYQAKQVLMAFFGLFYVAVMLSYIYQIRMLPGGAYQVWLVFISSWGCDTCAYCVGMLIGKHKMAPKLSPKKSIEGAIGGILGAALLGALYAVLIDKFSPIAEMATVSTAIMSTAIICGVGGAISQIGDLAASGIKRDHDIKDYGNLIPGHGGILDRFDSVIFTAPIIFYLLCVL